MDEKPCIPNWNLPGVEYTLGSVGESVARVNSCRAWAAAGICTDILFLASSEGEWIVPGVQTSVANVLTGCLPPEASMTRC